MAEAKTYLDPLPTTGYARNPELEAAVRAAPDDPAPYLVYADWLSQQGDPRGELIVIQHQRSEAGASKPMAKREAELLAEHRHFLGGIVTGHGPDHLRGGGDGIATVTWKWGCIESARLFNTIDWMDGGFPTRAVCERLFGVPAAAHLAELKVGVLRWEYQGEDVQALLEEAAKAPFARTLQVFRLGDVGGIDIDCAHHPLGELSGISATFPALRELTIWGCEFSLGDALVLPALRKLKIETCGLSQANLAAVVGATDGRAARPALGALEYLDLWFGSEDYGFDASLADLAPLLAGDALPHLKHLGLMNTTMADEICGAIGTSKILPQLTSLDLSMGTMTDAGARALLAHRTALRHLDTINVRRNFLSAAAIAELEGIGPKIIADDQKEDEGDYRYVSVAE